jgi:hypothetical protein
MSDGFFEEPDENDPMTIAFFGMGMEDYQWEVWQMAWRACEQYHNVSSVEKWEPIWPE